MNLIDLHGHTTASDGSLSPTELIKLADSLSITHLAVTDHDTIDGLAEACEAADSLKISLIAGIELSVDVDDDSIHLLGYGIDFRSKLLKETLSKLRVSRNDRNSRIVQKLIGLGYAISMDDVDAITTGTAASRGHIAKALITNGEVESVQDAFDKLLSRGKPAYCDRYRLSMAEACSLVHSVGGIAVWAHPGLHEDKLDRLLGQMPDWVKSGLDGIETDYSQHSVEMRDYLRSVAELHGLIYTGGSDFHGKLKPSVQLGDGPEKEPIDPSILEMIRERVDSVSCKIKKN